jgi:cytochrome P450
MAGLFSFRAMRGAQVKEVLANPESLNDQPYPIIYHRFLDPEAQKGGQPIPDATSLFNEAQVLMFVGADTVANTLMTGFFHILSQPALQNRLRDEVLDVWPDTDSLPPFETLETLPLLTGTIKEALRVTPGVPAPCTRIESATGAMIFGSKIPPATTAGMSILFVHNSSVIFKSPETFDADRWLAEDSKTLDQWLVAFSKGPRSCLDVNLGWCELYIAYATMMQHFDMRINGTTAEDLDWTDRFIPSYHGKHLRAWCQPVTAR